MQTFSFTPSTLSSELPYHLFNQARFSVCVVNRKWQYVFINQFGLDSLGNRSRDLIGKNMWNEFPELDNDFGFQSLKLRAEQGLETELVTVSPITQRKLAISAQVLEDCFLFTSSIIPGNEEIYTELKNDLLKRNRITRP